MREAFKTGKDAMLTKLFFRLLPVQILIVAMGAVNSIVDGAVAGQFIDSLTVGVIGLYYTVIRVLEAVGAVLLGGTAVLCGRYMGSGDIRRTRAVFSLNLTVTFAIGVLVTAVSFLFSGPLARALGATEELRGALVTYMLGYAVGVVPQLLAQQIAAFLQLERRSARGYAGVAGLIVSNVGLDLILVPGLKMGVLGLALATSLSNWIYFLILAPYYFTSRAQLRYRPREIDWRELPALVKIGLPGAMLVFCLALRTLALNRLLLTWSGNAGLSAMSAFNMISGLFIAFALGIGAVVRILGSVAVGEEDRDSIRQLVRIVAARALPLSLAVTALILALTTPVTLLFFPDRGSEVFRLTRQLFAIYGGCIPLIVVCCFFSNYLQSGGHHAFVNVLSVFDGFVAMVVPAALLAPKLGALGVWLANPIGILLTALMTPLYAVVFWRRLPRNLDEWLFLRPDFGAEESDRLDLFLTDAEEVTRTAAEVQAFCGAHRMPRKTACYAALCLEEMAGNVVEHGFAADGRRHLVHVRVVYREGGVLLRIKDDCIPFDPLERSTLFSKEDPAKNIGIRMVYRLADEVTYQNLLGLNVLTVRLSGQAAV